MSQNPGRAVTPFQVGFLFGNAYGKAATVRNAMNGFRKAGIYPFNPAVFEDHEFAPEVTDKPESNTLVDGSYQSLLDNAESGEPSAESNDPSAESNDPSAESVEPSAE